MKKILKTFILVSIFLLVGCQNNNTNNVLKTLEKKLEESKSYYIEGKMEIINNEDTYTYDVKVSHQKQDYYRIELMNTLNNHEQIILRNDDGVYVITPSLNKSFKFQSDWPYNNSQVYLPNSILEDLLEDNEREVKKSKNGYCISSTVNYPNNQILTKQKVYFDKGSNIKKIEVLDKDENIHIIMQFQKQEYNKKFEKNYFELSKFLNINNTKSDKEPLKEEPLEENKDTNTSSPTSTIHDVIYPMYLPTNTYLTSQETIDTEDGQRLILTFGGDSSFVLVEETSKYANEGLIIPVNGDFEFLNDVIGIINSNSLTWHSNGIDYYLASDSITTAELVNIANSISVLPVSK